MNDWTALLLAGSRPGGDPLTRSLGTDYKPLIPIAGEPMVLRPLRALLASPSVRDVRVLTQSPERLAGSMPDDPRLRVEQSRDTIAATLQAIVLDPATRFPLLVTTADHALLSPRMIEDFLVGSAECDIAVGLVDSGALLGRFPDAQRTWLRVGRGRYSGANLFAFNTPAAARAIAKWRSVEQDRKKGWRVLLQLGLPLFLGAVLRVRNVEQTATGLGRKLGIRVRAVVMDDPLAAIDVDKPADYSLVQAILAGRA
jgi:GTP:adenosylcobinamide-phosphate guanylyltransferase